MHAYMAKRLIVFYLVLLLVGCDLGPGAEKDNIVAKIGDKHITFEQLRDAVSYTNNSNITFKAVHYRAVLNRMINDEIVSREGSMRNQNLNAEYIKSIKKIKARAEQEKKELMYSLLLEQIGKDIPISKEELKEYYQRSKKRFLTSTLQLRRIIVNDEKQMQEVQRKIKSGEIFSKIAGRINADVELKKKKGDLGVLSLSEVPRNIRAAAFSLSGKGQIGKPFLLNNKWNILQLVRKEVGISRPFNDVKNVLEKELRRNKAVPKLTKILDKHKQELKVEIYDAALAKLAEASVGK